MVAFALQLVQVEHFTVIAYIEYLSKVLELKAFTSLVDRR